MKTTKLALVDFDGTITEFDVVDVEYARIRKHAANVLKYMEKKGWQIHIVTGQYDPKRLLEQYLKYHNIPFKTLNVIAHVSLSATPFEYYLEWKRNRFKDLQLLEKAKPKDVLVIDDREQILDIGKKRGYRTHKIERDADWLKLKKLI